MTFTATTPDQRRIAIAAHIDEWANASLVRCANSPTLFASDLHEHFNQWLMEAHPRSQEPSFRVWMKALREAGFVPTPKSNAPRHRQMVLSGWFLSHKKH